MEELISKLGNIAYRYDEGERPDFDAYIESLSAFGLPKDYLYQSIYEAPSFTERFADEVYDEERVARLGYPKEWLRRCGFHGTNMAFLSDEKIIEVCESLKAYDEKASGCKISFSHNKEDVAGFAAELLDRFK